MIKKNPVDTTLAAPPEKKYNSINLLFRWQNGRR